MAVVCAASLFAAAQGTSNASVEGKIVALEKLWNQAYKSGDTKALDAILDDSIVLINDDGSQQSKKEFLASVKATNAQEQQVAPELLKVTVHGEVAIASGVLRVKGVEGGKAYTRRERFVDTWLHKGDSWVCIATDATPIR
jgi:ketosteroid isomerase-like protein